MSVETRGTKAVTDRRTEPTAALTAARYGLTVLALVAGFAVGFLGAFSHRDQAVLFGVSWPVGLIYVFAGQIGLFLALAELPPGKGLWRPGRLVATCAAGLGWLIALLWTTYLGPPPSFALKGDVILANDWISMAYLIGGMGVATTAVYRSWLAALELKLAALRR